MGTFVTVWSHLENFFKSLQAEPSRDGASSVSNIQAAGVKVRPRPFTQVSTVERDALPLNRWPSIQVAALAREWRFVALEPMPLLPDVQKGTMVFPLRS